MGIDESGAIGIAIGILVLAAALATAYKLYHCKRNRELREDEVRTATTGQYHGEHCFENESLDLRTRFLPRRLYKNMALSFELHIGLNDAHTLL